MVKFSKRFLCSNADGDDHGDHTPQDNKLNIIDQMETLRTAILLKANALLDLTSFLERVKADDVKVSHDGKSFSASLQCPACEKIPNLSFAHHLTPSLYNFKKHFTSMHVDKPKIEPKQSKGQLKIADAFKRVTDKKDAFKDEETVDLTKEISNGADESSDESS